MIMNDSSSPKMEHVRKQFQDCMDFQERSFPNCQLHVFYLAGLAGHDELLREVIAPFDRATDEEASDMLSRPQYSLARTSKECVDGILQGKAALFHHTLTYLIDIARPVGRSVEQSETETVISGPHDGFVENLRENLAVVRQRVRSSHLKAIRLSVGEISKTDVVLLYIEDIVNPDYVEKLKTRIIEMEIDAVFEAHMLVQMIDENPNSIFPQFMTTERTDSAVSKLVAGRIVGFVDGSPTAFISPTSFFEFFSSPDDYYQRWHIGSALRLLRLVGFIITIGFTAFYVSVTTYHYEMIPHTMLLNLTESRSKVPFPPLIEALLMETTIELLREAGARLPTKIGQTIGIVGGIVIGQAAVQAGFTSNILIIAVATSAIASFVIPSYIMSASIRLIRFLFIILAGIWGNFGIMIGLGLVVIHLAGVTNLGTSYLTPVAPMNRLDWLDTFIRGPLAKLIFRPSIVRTANDVKNKMKR